MNLEQFRHLYAHDILALAEQHKAENVRVFGSILRGELGKSSDIDMLVHFRPDASLLDEAALERALNELCDRRIDLIGDDVVREELRPFIFADATPL